MCASVEAMAAFMLTESRASTGEKPLSRRAAAWRQPIVRVASGAHKPIAALENAFLAPAIR